MICKKKSLLVLSLSALFLGFFISLENVSALNFGYEYFRFRYNTPNNATYIDSGHKAYEQPVFNIHSINRVAAKSVTINNSSSSNNFMSVTAKFNVLTWTDNGNIGYLPDTSDTPVVTDVTINDIPVTFESSNLNIYKTDFICQPLSAGFTTNCRTFTYEFSFVVRNIPSNIGNIAFATTYDLGLFSGYVDGFNMYFEYDSNNKIVIDFAYDYQSALLLQQTQLQQLTINAIQDLNNTNEEIYNYITDTTAPSADTSILSGSAGWLPPGPVDSILTLPVQLAQGILNVFTGTNTCAPINVPLGIIDYTLQIPCMSPYFDIAQVNIVWNVVGAIISAFLIYNTLKWLYKFVDDTLTLRENNSTMWGGL